jgi:diguanylate cyclase (GGDEF)-like protein
MLNIRDLLETAKLKSITLTFTNKRLEHIYRKHDLIRLRRQSRIALLVGSILYGSYIIMDFLFISPQHLIKALYLHTMAMMIAFSVFALTYTKYFNKYNQPLLMVTGISAGICLLGIMSYMPDASISLFSAAIILITFWGHYFSGLRFINATAVGVMLLVLFNIMFNHLQFWTLFSINYFVVAGNILGGFASYIGEKQNRMLFLKERELDSERRLQHERALHDRLTGLPNRELLQDRVEQAITFASRQEQVSAGLFIDLDKFKPINDIHGHAAGDIVLQEVARRLLTAVREADTVSRLGGDEFFILAENIQTEAAAIALANKLLLQLQQPFKVSNEVTINDVSASIGICMFPYKNVTAVDVVRRADHAMYDVKNAGKSGVSVAKIG